MPGTLPSRFIGWSSPPRLSEGTLVARTPANAANECEEDMTGSTPIHGSPEAILLRMSDAAALRDALERLPPTSRRYRSCTSESECRVRTSRRL
jgi:hypothetical protein